MGYPPGGLAGRSRDAHRCPPRPRGGRVLPGLGSHARLAVHEARGGRFPPPRADLERLRPDPGAAQQHVAVRHQPEQPQPGRRRRHPAILLAARAQAGWRHIYLGSPVPGLRNWLRSRRQTPWKPTCARAGPASPSIRSCATTGRAASRRSSPSSPGTFRTSARSTTGAAARHGALSTLGPLWAALPLASVQRVTRPLAALL